MLYCSALIPSHERQIIVIRKTSSTFKLSYPERMIGILAAFVRLIVEVVRYVRWWIIHTYDIHIMFVLHEFAIENHDMPLFVAACTKFCNFV